LQIQILQVKMRGVAKHIRATLLLAFRWILLAFLPCELLAAPVVVPLSIETVAASVVNFEDLTHSRRCGGSLRRSPSGAQFVAASTLGRTPRQMGM